MVALEKRYYSDDNECIPFLKTDNAESFEYETTENFIPNETEWFRSRWSTDIALFLCRVNVEEFLGRKCTVQGIV